VRKLLFLQISQQTECYRGHIEAVRLLAGETGKSVIASGGVSGLADLAKLREYSSEGVAGAIVGKAIYEGRFTVAEALKEVKESC
jgi:phosphoribosylformimino-5-aminoimidazole carboxamide ribotide isomerase